MSITKIFTVLLFSKDMDFLTDLKSSISKEVKTVLAAQTMSLATHLLHENKDATEFVVIDLGDGDVGTAKAAFLYLAVVRNVSTRISIILMSIKDETGTAELCQQHLGLDLKTLRVKVFPRDPDKIAEHITA